MIIGIDPGFNGAIVALGDDENYLRQIVDMPLKEVNGRKVVDAKKLFHGMRTNFGMNHTVVIEEVHAMPGQGVTSMFRFGYGAGVIEGVCAGLCYNILKVKPAVWKSALGLPSEKNAARKKACEIFSLYKDHFARVKDDGRAEAALIAYFAFKYL